MAKGGTVRKKGNKWIWVGYYKDDSGKEHRPNKTFKTKKEAEAYRILQIKESKHIKNVKSETDYTVEEFYRLWQKKTQWDTETYYRITTTNNWRYLYNKNILPYIGMQKLQNIDYTKLQEFFNRGVLSQKSYKNIKQAIKSMLDYAKQLDENLIIVDNLHKVKIVSRKSASAKVFNLLSESQYEEVFNYMKANKLYYANLISLLHETGLRIEEALALKKESFDLNRNILTVNSAIKRKNITNRIKDKTQVNTVLVESAYLKSSSSNRAVPINEMCFRAIKAQLALLKERNIESRYLFPTSKGKPADARNVLRSFHSAIEQCNLLRSVDCQIPKRGLHSLRKLYCKRLRDEANLEWQQMALLMGHSNSEVTKNYYYSVSDDDITEIAKLLNATDPRLKEEARRQSMETADGDWNMEYIEFVDE